MASALESGKLGDHRAFRARRAVRLTAGDIADFILCFFFWYDRAHAVGSTPAISRMVIVVAEVKRPSNPVRISAITGSLFRQRL